MLLQSQRRELYQAHQLSNQGKEENNSTVNQLMVQIQELQDKVNSWKDAKEFYDPPTASSSGLSNVPSQPMGIPSPRGTTSRDSCLQPDTRNSLGASGHVFEGLLAPGEPSSALFGNSKNLASSSCRSKPTDTGKIAEHREVLRKKPQNCSIPTPQLARKFSTWNPLYHAGGTYFSKLDDGNSGESDLGTASR